MIKNNFILSESEKSRILTLHRLPNHKPSYRLNEQKLIVNWNSDTNKAKADADANRKSGEANWSKILSGGKMSLIDFDDKRRVTVLTDWMGNEILKGWRSTAFGYFQDALNYKGYTDLSKKIDNAVSQIKMTVESDGSYNIDNWDPLSSPTSNSEDYKVEDVTGPVGGNYFGDINKYQLKNMGRINQPGYSQKPDVDVIKSGMNLTPSQCIGYVQSYLNQGYRQSLSDQSKKELKYSIAWCQLGNLQQKKNRLTGKISFPDSNLLKSLKSKTKEQLETFYNKPDGDRDKIYLDDINRNLMLDEENKNYKK